MNIMKNAEFPDDWLLGLRQVVRDPALYELLKYCPLEIMQCWRFDDISRGALICRQGEICQQFSLIVAGEVDVFTKLKMDVVTGRRVMAKATCWASWRYLSRGITSVLS